MATLTWDDFAVLRVIDSIHDCEEHQIYEHVNLPSHAIASAIQHLEREGLIIDVGTWHTTEKGFMTVVEFAEDGDDNDEAD